MPPEPLPYREVRRRPIAAGFVEVGQKGSHVKFEKELSSNTLIVIVTNHREVAGGTIRGILRQARLSIEEFDQL